MPSIRIMLGVGLLISVLLHLAGSAISIVYFTQVDAFDPADAIPVQLVDLVATPNDIRPEQAKFVGSSNNSTSSETVAERTAPKKTSPGSTARNTAAKPKQKGEQGGQAMVAPSTAVIEHVGTGFGGTVPEDYFRNFRRGPHTYVNVLRHPGVDYFVELKRSIKIAWNPRRPVMQNVRHSAVRRGQLAAVVGAAVNSSGELAELFILESSGLPAYDQEAMRAFRATYPTFPPGDETMHQFAKNGMLRMSWALITQIHG